MTRLNSRLGNLLALVTVAAAASQLAPVKINLEATSTGAKGLAAKNIRLQEYFNGTDLQ